MNQMDFSRLSASLALLILVAGAPAANGASHEHLVTSKDLRSAVERKADQRQADVQKIENFLASTAVKELSERTHFGLEQVREAVIHLDDAELSRLAENIRKAEEEVSGGALSNQQITYILIALTTAVVVMLIMAD